MTTASTDISQAVEGLLTAALSGDGGRFSQYLASSCDNRGDLIAAVGTLRRLLPAGHLQVQVSNVEVDVRDEAHVSVTGLPGLKVLVDGTPLPGTTAIALSGTRLDLVREAGTWRLENCQALAK